MSEENYFLVRIVTPKSVESYIDFSRYSTDAIVACLRRSGRGQAGDVTIFCRRLSVRPASMTFEAYARQLRKTYGAF